MTATPKTLSTPQTTNLFAARWPGVCAECATDFDADDDVTRNTSGDLICAPCATQQDPKPLYGVCDTCFLTKTRSGACGCL